MKLMGDRHFQASTVRLLRLSTNSFLSSLDLVIRMLEEFAPDEDDPVLTDEKLREEARKANEASGAIRGIELKGDGKGAGSGQEVKA
jgi:EKC/KEOPS complex subunit PCC1/LAGE3